MGVALIGFLGVLVGAFVTAFKEWLFKNRDQKKKVEYLAIRVCSMLDRFVYACADVVEDNGTSQGQREADGSLSPQTDLPEIGFDALNVDWQSLPATLSYHVLTLPNEVERAKMSIHAASEHAFPPDYEEAFEARQMEYAKLGLRAAELSNALRKFAKLPEREVREWDPLDTLRARLEPSVIETTVRVIGTSG
jgi:hypothetical protein